MLLYVNFEGVGSWKAISRALILNTPQFQKCNLHYSSLSELLSALYTDFKADTCDKLARYLKNNEEHNVLIIADGWEDLQISQCQAGSFLHSLFFSSDVIPTADLFRSFSVFWGIDISASTPPTDMKLAPRCLFSWVLRNLRGVQKNLKIKIYLLCFEKVFFRKVSLRGL